VATKASNILAQKLDLHFHNALSTWIDYMLLGARHVPERLCSGPCPQRGAIASARPYLFYRS